MSEIKSRIALAIVSYNSAAKLKDCLLSLKQDDYPCELLDYILIDNNSSDESVRVAQTSGLSFRIIKNDKNLGFAGANNQAYELAKELKDDYLVLLNDDTVVELGWLSRLIATAESSPKIAAVQSKLLLYPENDLLNSFGNALTFLGFGYCNYYRQPDQPGQEPFETAYPSGAAVAIKLSALEQTGLFDEKFFMYHEDVDLGWRLRLAGYQIVLEPNSVVYHKYSFAKADYKYYYMERNRLLVYFKNFHWLTLLIFAPAFTAMELGICFFAWRNGWLKQKLSGYVWLLKNWQYLVGERRKIKRLRIVGDREILKLLIAEIKFQDIDNPLLTRIVNPAMAGYLWLAKKIIFW